MWQEERHQRIKALLSAQQRISIEQIISTLNVSRETVRRDVLAMEQQGLLKRVHGGIIQTEDEAPIAERAQSRVQYKRDIARATLPFIRPGQTLFMDAGTTTTILAEELAQIGGVTVITNSFDAALKLRSAPNIEIIVLGGNINHRAPATIGSKAIAEIYQYKADLALLSPVALDVVQGACNYDYQETELAQAMARQSKARLILADYSKLGQSSRAQYCALKDITQLITNKKAKENPALQEIAQAVPHIIFA
ncbi:DeoR/GlpR family DNA-binding transcription regulator [Leeia oryzae]|uniref:DeoR/GlpR family DNA-binding transcription regulator n=1 Tax=Leeia oryzae TaxID=356662 RepID=UPI00036AE8BB|nr:DeoR/GlpR family DNA-binding transcription regulator [Leeia oryzae]